jgi:hypothetical protein
MLLIGDGSNPVPDLHARPTAPASGRTRSVHRGRASPVWGHTPALPVYLASAAGSVQSGAIR